MPSLKELSEKLNAMIAAGKGEERGALFLPAVEARSRVKNEKGRTRFIMETNSPEFYSRFNAQKDRYLSVVENKTIGLEVMLSVLESKSDQDLLDLARGE